MSVDNIIPVDKDLDIIAKPTIAFLGEIQGKCFSSLAWMNMHSVMQAYNVHIKPEIPVAKTDIVPQHVGFDKVKNGMRNITQFLARNSKIRNGGFP